MLRPEGGDSAFRFVLLLILNLDGRRMSVNGKVWGNRLAQIIFLLILLGSCEWAVRSGLISTLYLAAPTEVIRVFVSYFTTEPIFTDIYVTLSEYFAGFAIAIVIGVGGGVFLAIIPKLERFSSPFFGGFNGDTECNTDPTAYVMAWDWANSKNNDCDTLLCLSNIV